MYVVVTLVFFWLKPLIKAPENKRPSEFAVASGVEKTARWQLSEMANSWRLWEGHEDTQVIAKKWGMGLRLWGPPIRTKWAVL